MQGLSPPAFTSRTLPYYSIRTNLSVIFAENSIEKTRYSIVKLNTTRRGHLSQSATQFDLCSFRQRSGQRKRLRIKSFPDLPGGIAADEMTSGHIL